MSDTAAIAEETKGWLWPEEGPALRQYALESQGPYLELGTYCGKSTLWLGDAARANGTVLFTVDHHRGSPEMRPGQDCHDPDVLDDNGRHDTLPLVRRTLSAADLEAHVVLVVGDTHTVGRYWETPVGLLFVDAGHDADSALEDYRLFAPWLREGGVLLFHDVSTDARAAVAQAEEDGWKRVELVHGCLGVYRR